MNKILLPTCFVVCLLSAACQGSVNQERATERPVQKVSVEKVTKSDIVRTVESVGLVQAFYLAIVRPRVDGLLTHLHFREGQWVTANQLLAELDASPFRAALGEAEGQYARDEAARQNAALMLSRNSALRKQNLIAQQAVDDQNAVLGQATGAVQYDQALVAAAKLSLEYTQVRAPIAGRLGIRQVDPGNLVHPTDANGIVTIAQTDPIAVIYSLPSRYLPDLQSAMKTGPVKVRVRAQAQGTILSEGVVSVIDNQINAATGTLKIKALFKNPDSHLWPNQFLRVETQLEPYVDALSIPSPALAFGAETPFVMVLTSEGRVRKQDVQVTTTLGDRALVTGLDGTERVIVSGQHRLHDGDRAEETAGSAELSLQGVRKNGPQ